MPLSPQGMENQTDDHSTARWDHGLNRGGRDQRKNEIDGGKSNEESSSPRNKWTSTFARRFLCLVGVLLSYLLLASSMLQKNDYLPSDEKSMSPEAAATRQDASNSTLRDLSNTPYNNPDNTRARQVRNATTINDATVTIVRMQNTITRASPTASKPKQFTSNSPILPKNSSTADSVQSRQNTRVTIIGVQDNTTRASPAASKPRQPLNNSFLLPKNSSTAVSVLSRQNTTATTVRVQDKTTRASPAASNPKKLISNSSFWPKSSRTAVSVQSAQNITVTLTRAQDNKARASPAASKQQQFTSSSSVFPKNSGTAVSVQPRQTSGHHRTNTTNGTASSRVDENSSAAPAKKQGKLTQGGKDDFNDSRLRNLRLVFIGDSITRYQYLNLAHYARFGHWMNTSQAESGGILVVEKEFGSWMSFFNYSNAVLQPHEQCDCFRFSDVKGLTPMQQVRKKILYENRYYHDYERNVHVTFIQKFGGFDAWGHWNATETRQPHPFDAAPKRPKWSHDWASTIRHHLALLDPKPDYVVLNTGFWGSGGLELPKVQRSIEDALRDAGMVGIYKTTTARKFHRAPLIRPHDVAMCDLFKFCLNVSYTYRYGAPDYWDSRHFRGHVYSRMNLELLQMIGIIANDKQTISSTRGE